MHYLSLIIIIAYLAVLAYLTLVRPAQQSINSIEKSALKPGVYLHTSTQNQGIVEEVLEHSVIITRTDGLKVEVLNTTITHLSHGS